MEIIHYSVLRLVLNAVENIGYPYFEVPTIDNPRKLQERERVFCYELYHRMRQTQDNYCKSITLNSKSNRAKRISLHSETPDFIFYVSETDANDTAIIEVRNTRRMIENDIQKIDDLISQDKCKVGISLIYSQTFSSVEKYIKSLDELREIENKDSIFIIAASDPAHMKYKSLVKITGG